MGGVGRKRKEGRKEQGREGARKGGKAC